MTSNATNHEPDWVAIVPRFRERDISMQRLIDFASTIAQLSPSDDNGQQAHRVAAALNSAIQLDRHWPAVDRATLLAVFHILSDLATQHWHIRVSGGTVEAALPSSIDADPIAEKARIRNQELVKRNEQLGEPSVRAFITNMEKRRLTPKGFVSIYSLMRDGRELTTALESARGLFGQERLDALRLVIDPQIEVVADGAVCETTGYRLMDIWRYFRHTWSNQYVSVPGRSMMFLVRDGASAFRPIIGIGAISSPIVQIRERDRWIGWDPERFFDDAKRSPSLDLAAWIATTAHRAIGEIYVDDLMEDGIVTLADLRKPTPEFIARLLEFSKDQGVRHQRFVNAGAFKPSPASAVRSGGRAKWVVRARSHLFKCKRSRSLAELLRARSVIDSFLGEPYQLEHLERLLACRDGKNAVLTVLRKAKSDRVGIAMADISVCGAVAPYGPLLGGKHVAMHATSPQIIHEYRTRYAHAESEIASAMAGRPVVRPAELVLLGTTSLYGIGSSQYNRVRIPAEAIGGRSTEEIRFYELGRSESFGTSHFSAATVAALARVVEQSTEGARIHSIFGEGVSPKLRKIRDGLVAVGLPADRFLRHGRRRIVYGIPLARNFREYLLGFEHAPDYVGTIEGQAATAAICEWWRRRWLANRIDYIDMVATIATHTHVRPMRHGARVDLPIRDPGRTSAPDD